MENQLSAKYAFDGADKSGTSIFASYSDLIKVNMQQRFSLHRCLKKEKREGVLPSFGIEIVVFRMTSLKVFEGTRGAVILN